jgi:nucleotide-binding universal stress UspA family protein
MANAGPRRVPQDSRPMSADIIVSYDGTPNDDDALALGQALAAGGASLALAYVRHSREFDPAREELAAHDARRRLDGGLALLGDDSVPTHVVFSASTDSGLEQLAAAEGAKLIVFGSDYRTTPGRAEPGNTAQRLLEGAPVAVGVAQAGLRTELGTPISSIAAAPADVPLAREAAQELAGRLGARLVSNGAPADLIVVASPPGGPPGRVSLSGSARTVLNGTRGSVVVLPAGVSRLL